MVLEYTKSDLEDVAAIATLEIQSMKKHIKMMEEIIASCHKDIANKIEVANRFLNEGKLDIYEFFTKDSIPASRRLISICKKTIEDCRNDIAGKEDRVNHYRELFNAGKMPPAYSYTD
jgi:hypothetical protein